MATPIKDKLVNLEILKSSQDYIDNKKINKNQGIENNGKVLGVGSDGNVSPIEPPKTTIIDTTLSNSGQAADSKAVGDKIKEEIGKCVKSEPGKVLSSNDFTDEYKKRIDDLSYVKIAFSSASLDKASNEIGSIVTAVNVNWKLNKTPKLLKIQFGSEAQETLVNTVTSKSYTGKAVKTNTNIVLSATDERNSVVTKQLTIAFQPMVYWGIADNKSNYSSADILGLSNSVLASSRQRTLNVNATAGKHIIYVIPSSFGTPVFNVGGFDGGFIKVGTVSHTNASGHTQNYDVWKSVNAGLGNVSVLVK